jgi:hypothetical protein
MFPCSTEFRSIWVPEPEVIAQEIVENLESALEQFSEIETELTIK